MARLPTVGGDSGSWATVLNEFLEVAHDSAGLPKVGDGALSWRLNNTHSIGATTLTLKGPPLAVGANQGFVIIDPFTTEAEIRRVSGVSGSTLTITAGASPGLTYAHADTDVVLWFPGGLVPWTMFGAKGNGSTSDATTNVTAFNRLTDQLYNLGTFFRGGIQIPQGHFYIDDELHPERDMVLQGVNAQNSKITAHTTFSFDGTANRCMIRPKRDGSIVATDNLVSARWWFRDFYLDGGSIANSNGILFSPQQPDFSRDIRIDNCKGAALHLVDVQQHILKNYEAINCGTALKLGYGVRFLYVDGFNAENTDLHVMHAYTTAGDGNCSRENHFENVHIETMDASDAVHFLIDPTNASSPDNSGWVFDHFHMGVSGTQTMFKFLGSSIPSGYSMKDIRGYGSPATVIAIDDAWQAKQWRIRDDFNDRIDNFRSALPTSSSASFPRGTHSTVVARTLGQEARMGVPAGTSGQPVSNFYSNVGTQSNVNHFEARSSADTLLWRVDGNGRQTLAGGAQLLTNAGSPEGSVTAPVGSICSDITNGVLYMKKTGAGNTGWKLVTQAA